MGWSEGESGFWFGCLCNPDVAWVDFNLKLLGWKGLAWL